MVKRRQEDDEAPPLGVSAERRRKDFPRQPVHRNTPVDGAMDYAVQQFLLAVQRCAPEHRSRLPESYEGKVPQKRIRDHFAEWVDSYGVKMTQWGVKKFFREVYLWQKDDNSYNFAPHSNLSNWMATAGSRAIRTELRGQVVRQMLWENAREAFKETGRYPDHDEIFDTGERWTTT